LASALAFLLGANQPASLFLLFLALFAADMNLRAVLRKAGNGKLAGAGGYLAHVGFGIMLAGIVVSGVYAKSTRVTLPVGKPVSVGGNTLTFLRVLPATATDKQAMEVRVKTAAGKSFYAYPKMYVNSKTNQLMANPAIRRTAAADLYLAPQSYDPGQPEQVGRDLRMTKGTTQNIDGIGFTFRDFNADRSAMMRGEKTILVLTDVTITPSDGVNRDATLRYVWNMETRQADAPEMEIPGVPGGKMRVLAVSPSDGAVVLRLTGVSKDPKAEYQAADGRVAVARRDAQASDLARLGGLFTCSWPARFSRSSRDPARHVEPFSQRMRPAGAAARGEPVPAPTGPVVPAHGRSSLDPSAIESGT
jgi:cytochrome c-type biogenesis protein CcmF